MKIKIENSWNNLTYYFMDEVIPHDRGGIIVLENEKGLRHSFRYHMRDLSGTYGDMGHTYSFSTKEMVILFREFEIDFEALVTEQMNVICVVTDWSGK